MPFNYFAEIKLANQSHPSHNSTGILKWSKHAQVNNFVLSHMYEQYQMSTMAFLVKLY